MTALGEILARRIAAEGPMRLDHYMAECLLHPAHGYYTTRKPFGRAGDFVTAPEISQMFGEMLGLCLAQAWIDQGRPAPFILAELGPGRGTLMADFLRAIRAVPGMPEAARVCLVEASPTLRAEQGRLLGAVEWFDTMTDLPEGPLFLVANEFFDALPIRQFVRRGAGWAERQVGLVEGALVPGLAPPAPLALLEGRLKDTEEGDVVEICPLAPGVAAEMGRRIAASGGAAVLVDYGHWRSLGDTFQALSAHAPCDPFEAPGAADLTAHVAFEPLARAARAEGAATSAMTAQGVLLERLGITARAQALARGLAGPALATHIAAHRRLTHPEEMGQLFQTLAITPAQAPLPPGFDPAPKTVRNMATTLEILKSPLLSGLGHGFFTRRGGASSGIYQGLNCGFGSQDQREAVALNRARVAEAMGVAPEAMAAVNQVHSPDVAVIEVVPEVAPVADALVTNVPGILLTVLTADCQPVLFADREAGVIGAAHAGWKGALAGVLEATLDAMEGLGAERGRTVAVIGPCISQRAYEVGEDFMENFLVEDAAYGRFFSGGPAGKPLFDLPSFGLHRLREAGVGSAEWIGRCTYSDPAKFYSYRRTTHLGEADYGRLISAIRL